MNHLLNIVGATDRAAVSETNFERLAVSRAFQVAPTPVAGVPNTVVGPPTVGTYVLNDLWIDSLGSEWRCTVPGTPGTWAQITPAVVAAFPGGAVAGYRVVRTDLAFAQFYWDGAAWQQLYASAASFYTEGNGVPGVGTVGGLYLQLDANPRMLFLKVAGAWQGIMQVEGTGGSPVAGGVPYAEGNGAPDVSLAAVLYVQLDTDPKKLYLKVAGQWAFILQI
jgi:hypothetical protein